MHVDLLRQQNVRGHRNDVSHGRHQLRHRHGNGGQFLEGNFYKFNTSPNEKIADARAIRNDWQMVGQDMRKVMSAFATGEGAGLVGKF
jgi:hypothetical protein